MKATITEIGQMQTSAKDGKPFQPVYFRLETGGSARTYLSPTNKNYSKWKEVLQVGAVLTNLQWKNQAGKLIDADSSPIKI